MTDLRLITDEEIADIMSDQTKATHYGELSRVGLLSTLKSMKGGGENIPLDSYYIIEARLGRLIRFKEIQETQLNLFTEVLRKY